MAQPHHADLLIIGGGVAGVRCARTLRRHGYAGTITLIGDEPMPPYNRPPLSKELLRHDEQLADELLLAEAPAWYQKRGVELRTGAVVSALDPDAHRATVSDGTTIGYGRCLLATGAAPRRLPITGGDEALLLRTLADARRMRAAMDAHIGERVVVVGGGFIGLEVASALAARGLRPTVVELGSSLWSGQLGALLDERARELLDAVGVTVRLGAAVTRLDGRGAWIDEELLPARFVVAGVGVTPRDELAREAGLATADGIEVDASGRTSDAAIWAAGDVARVDGVRVEHWHAAREAGERAAASMLGQPVADVPVPWVFSAIAGTAIDVIGSPAAADRERWLAGGQVVASLREGRTVGLAVLGGAMAPKLARDLVARSVSEAELAGVLGG